MYGSLPLPTRINSWFLSWTLSIRGWKGLKEIRSGFINSLAIWLSMTSSCSWGALVPTLGVRETMVKGRGRELQQSTRELEGRAVSCPAHACEQVTRSRPGGMHHVIMISVFWVRDGLIWVCNWGKKWAGAAAHAVTVYGPPRVQLGYPKSLFFLWGYFRDFLRKMFPQTRCLKEKVWQPRPITPIESSHLGGGPQSNSTR